MKLSKLIVEAFTEDNTYYLGYDMDALESLTKYLENTYEDGRDYIAHVGRGDDFMNAFTALNTELLQDRHLMDLVAAAETEEELNFVGESENPADKVTLDIPLFIRLLEYAKEDAKSDMDLHDVAERAIRLGSTHDEILTMQDYKEIVGNKKPE